MWLLMLRPFFIIRLSKSIYKFGYKCIGQHIGYRLSNIKNYRLSFWLNFSYRWIPNWMSHLDVLEKSRTAVHPAAVGLAGSSSKKCVRLSDHCCQLVAKWSCDVIAWWRHFITFHKTVFLRRIHNMITQISAKYLFFKVILFIKKLCEQNILICKSNISNISLWSYFFTTLIYWTVNLHKLGYKVTT